MAEYCTTGKNPRFQWTLLHTEVYQITDNFFIIIEKCCVQRHFCQNILLDNSFLLPKRTARYNCRARLSNFKQDEMQKEIFTSISTQKLNVRIKIMYIFEKKNHLCPKFFFIKNGQESIAKLWRENRHDLS